MPAGELGSNALANDYDDYDYDYDDYSMDEDEDYYSDSAADADEYGDGGDEPPPELEVGDVSYLTFRKKGATSREATNASAAPEISDSFAITGASTSNLRADMI